MIPKIGILRKREMNLWPSEALAHVWLPFDLDRIMTKGCKILHRRSRISNSGFSMTELMVTLAIVGILMKIVLPNFLTWAPVLKLSGAARQMATDLQLARAQAIAKNASQAVTFNTSAGTYSFGSESRSLPSLFPGISISSATNTTFTPRGTATAVTITLTDGTNQKLVCVKSMGRVAIKDTSCS
jgi:prepilin-type N-terminal cleavage/methylation domain-containing protein